jgi:predicted nucleic acid-binding Zn ribbon protein
MGASWSAIALVDARRRTAIGRIAIGFPVCSEAEEIEEIFHKGKKRGKNITILLQYLTQSWLLALAKKKESKKIPARKKRSELNH